MKHLKYFLLVVAAVLFTCAAHGQAVSHTATYSINNSGCTTTAICTAQIWRAVISGGTCPVAGNAAYIQVQSALAATSTSSTTSHWDYIDSGSTLTSGSIYCGYATNTFLSGGGPSAASAIFQGQIPTPTAAAPIIAVTLK
jgi:hypothetical protein